MNLFKKIGVSLLLPYIAAAIGSYYTMPAISTWYATLQKPSFNPPNWVFGPVWTVLYLLMGISLYLVWSAPEKKKIESAKKAGYIFYGCQLFLNTLWSIVFFGLQSPSGALSIIMLLWLSILGTIWKFYTVNSRASYLLIPYLLWVTFATCLNYFIVILN